MALYLGSEPVRLTQGSKVEIESPAVRQIIEGTISEYSNSRVSTVGSYAFAYCSSLASIDLPQATLIRNSAFYACESLTSVSLPQATTISNNAFAYCSFLTSINLPQAITIGAAAFNQCYALTSINLPQVTSIGTYVFSHCYSLTTINLPKCTYIGGVAFASCQNLISINLLECTSIGNSVFDECYSLTTVNLPKCVYIGNYAFNYCYNLLSLYLLGSSVPTLSNISAFSSTPISNYTTSTGGVYGSIYVPASLYNSYIAATNWSTYSARIVGMSWNQLTSENCTIESATMNGTNYYLGAVLNYRTTVISAPTIKVTFKGQEYICSQYSGTMNGYTTYAYGADSDIPTLTPHFDDGHPFLLWCQTRNNINLNNIVIDSNVVEEGEIVSIKIEEQVNSLP